MRRELAFGHATSKLARYRSPCLRPPYWGSYLKLLEGVFGCGIEVAPRCRGLSREASKPWTINSRAKELSREFDQLTWTKFICIPKRRDQSWIQSY